LNEEAASLDWTRSRGHTLNVSKIFDSYEDDFVLEPDTVAFGHRLGGESSSLASSRALAGAAAYSRLLNASTATDFENMKLEPDPDDHNAMHVDVTIGTSGASGSRSHADQRSVGYSEAGPDVSSNVPILNKEVMPGGHQYEEPDSDDGTSGFEKNMEVECGLQNNITVSKSEPDPDDSSNAILNPNDDLSIDLNHSGEINPNDTACCDVLESGIETEVMAAEQIRTLNVSKSEGNPNYQSSDSNTNELQRIEEPVVALCARLQKAVEMLRLQATPTEADSAIQTLFKIIKNVIEHPNDIKYKRLRKSNPHFQRSVANYKAAMEVLELIGFCEDVISDEVGRVETYLVLKRNDPGLLWLAKSSLEVSLA
jgi:hypothetical protein